MISVFQIITTLAALIAAIATGLYAFYTIRLWNEAREARKASYRPLLVPWRLHQEPEIPGVLFTGNFSYPMTGELDIKFNGLAYLGIKNIGVGPACLCKVTHFKDNKMGIKAESTVIPADVQELMEDNDIDKIDIPPGGVIPLVVRYGYSDVIMDLEHASKYVTIRYYDLAGDPFELHLDLWFRNLEGKGAAEANVIRYSAEFDHKWSDLPTVIFRHMEHKGFFEAEGLFHQPATTAPSEDCHKSNLPEEE